MEVTGRRGPCLMRSLIRNRPLCVREEHRNAKERTARTCSALDATP